ncbi:MAG: amidophosphoribosyltransferase [Neptuniibacter caesariensis]|uniref:Amidophosphoribosyltransferase n=1 Tax=Neptuniibacter caesariensis TaxID=207954 RepID=A0A2G6JNU9_NEPCE|nr:MAG: amidophosphoribosyltransferase [Neptuniibacter caesariensis]
MITPKVNYRSFFNTCILCSTSRFEGKNTLTELCPACFNDLPWITDKCQRCALPLEAHVDHHLLCGQCIRKPPIYDKVEALFHYQFPLDQLITKIKYNRKNQYLGALCELMDHALPALTNLDAIMAVPLYPKNLHQRGFNQAEILARYLGKKRRIKFDGSALRKDRPTQHQMSLHRSERFKNLKDAFSCQPLRYKHVGLVDDVMTTGTTLNQLSKVLKEAGVAKVTCLVLCRTDK